MAVPMLDLGAQFATLREDVMSALGAVIERCDALEAHAGKLGVGCAVYYPTPLHLQPCLASPAYDRGQFPEAERVAGEVLSLPVYPELTNTLQHQVIEPVRSFYQ